MNKDTDFTDPIGNALAEVMTNVNRFSTHPEITKACGALLVAANELIALRHAESLRKEDILYLNSALTWADKARDIVSDLVVDLHEGKI